MTLDSTGRHGEIIIYQAPDGKVALDVHLEWESLWLNQKQLAELFATERGVITKHLRNLFASGELNGDSVCAKFAHTADDDKIYQVDFFNLDAIISVGYRVNSRRGTQFRIWATQVLRDHLLKGYSVNEKRLQELNQAVRLIADVVERRDLSGDEAAALLRVVGGYSRALDLLDDYDHQRISKPECTQAAVYMLTIDDARRIVDRLRERFGASGLFGIEKDKGLESAPGAVIQTARTGTCIPAWKKRRRTCSISWSRAMLPWTATSGSPRRCSSGSWIGTARFTEKTDGRGFRTRPWWLSR